MENNLVMDVVYDLMKECYNMKDSDDDTII